NTHEMLTIDNERMRSQVAWLTEENDRLKAELAEQKRRHNQFVIDMGTTCYACPDCGHARTARECVWCDREQLRERLKLYDWLVQNRFDLRINGTGCYVVNREGTPLGPQGDSPEDAIRKAQNCW